VINDRAKAIRSALLTAYNVGKAGGGKIIPHGDPKRDENFESWFAGSKLTDKNGEPLRLYHITPKSFSMFNPGGDDSHKSGPAIWLGPTPNGPAAHNVQKGWTYDYDAVGAPKNSGSMTYKEGVNVMPVHANIRRPLVIDNQTKDWAASVYGYDFPHLITPDLRKQLIEDGYDGVMLHDKHDNLSEIAVLHPNQIKSAIGNRGTFDPNESDITKAGGGDVDFFHGSPETAPTFKIDESPRRVYSGIFGTKNNQIAKSHGKNLYTVKVPENKILSNYELNYEIPYEKVSSIIKKLHPHGDQDIAHHLIVEDGDVFKTDPQELERIFRTSDAGEAGWAAQDSKGKLAKALGYDAVQTPDEHGEGTHLIVNGTAFRHTPDITKAGGGDVEPDDSNPLKSGGMVEPYKHTGVIHPARMIPGVHIRHETHGTPIFTGGKDGR
jgi:hypothetical protein